MFATLLMGCFVTQAHDFEVDGIYYNINADGTTVSVTYKGASSYGSNSYSGAVTIPESVTFEGVTYSVTEIGRYAFDDCELTYIDIPSSVSLICDNAFYDCDSLKEVEIPGSVTSIGSHAFSFCSSLSSVTIPNSVTSIGYSAFGYCNSLSSVHIPNSVTSIGDGAFGNCRNLSSITVESGNPVYDMRDNCNGIVETSSNTLIAGCVNTVIPNTVTAIRYAFAGCEDLTSIDIPNSVTEIGRYAFDDCGLTHIDIPSSVILIGDNAFYDCDSLKEVEIPGSVTSIGSHAFSFCSSLSSVTIPNSVTSIGYSAFGYCNSLSSVHIPNSVTSIGDGAFGNCRNLSSITVESGNPVYDMRDNCNGIVETSSNTLIAGCVNTVIPNTVTAIRYAFAGCEDLTSIDIPNSVTEIGRYAFDNCGLTHIDIPSSVTLIGDNAFSDCDGLTEVDIPGSVTAISSSAFSFCKGLSSVTIPGSVTSIGRGAFNYCESLSSVTCLAMAPPVMQSSDCFSDETYADASLQVPLAAIEEYRSTDYWNKFFNIVSSETFEEDGIYYRVIGENTVCVIHREGGYSGQIVIPESVSHDNVNYSVVGIEAKAFDGCSELTSVEIGDAVEIIGKAAFQGCTGLTSVTIGSSVYLIKEMTFDGCDALTLVMCHGMIPPVMAESNCFTSTAYSNATLRMPHEAVSAYSSADYWRLFKTIKGYGTAGPGDVDGDNVVSIRDVSRLIDYLLGVNSGDFYFGSADMNGNGRIDIADVTTLIDNMLNGDY